MWGLTQRELVGDASKPPFITRLLRSEIDEITMPTDVPDLADCVGLALRGGYPEVVRVSGERAHKAWLASYIDQLVTPDVAAAGIVRDPNRLRRYLQAAVANTAGQVEHKVLYDAADITRVTGSAYDGLLQSLFITEHIPAWRSSRLGQLLRTPKRYLVEASLLGPLCGVNERAVLRSADLLGRVIDTFVVQQLRPELPLSEQSVRMFHLRDSNGRREVDLLLETSNGDIAAFEIKSDAAVGAASARHLTWLRDKLGEKFRIGVVFHSGPRPFKLDEKIFALPIATIWG